MYKMNAMCLKYFEIFLSSATASPFDVGSELS